MSIPQHFSTVSKALLATFEPTKMNEHGLICRDVKAGKFVVLPKGAIPPGYDRLSLNEIVSIIKKSSPQIEQDDKKALSTALAYMGSRKVITSSQSEELESLGAA